MPSNEKAVLILSILFSALGIGSAVRAAPVPPQAVLSSPGPTDLFGFSVALSSDGRTAVVGTANANQAFIFVQSGGAWALDAGLSGPSGFGDQVAISADGTVVLVANTREPCLTSFSCGAVYAYTRKNGTWTQEAHLTAGDTFDFEGGFGFSLALSADGSTALIGRISESCFPVTCRGAVYVYDRDTGGNWSLAGRLAAPTPSDDSFGAASALSDAGNLALVGAPGIDCPAGVNCGKAYAFVRSGGTWSYQAELAPSDPHLGAAFGTSVALSADGNVGLIGSPENGTGLVPSSVYEFVRSGGSWVERQKIASAGAGGDFFGSDLSLSDDGRTALVGASGTDCKAGIDCGTAYWLTRTGEGWTTPMALLELAPGDLGGFSVALSGDAATGLAGAPGGPCAGGACGAVYVLGLPASTPVIPTASGVGLVLLALLLAVSGARVLARRRRSAWRLRRSGRRPRGGRDLQQKPFAELWHPSVRPL